MTAFDPYFAARDIDDLVERATAEYADRWVRLTRGKYRGHCAKVRYAVLSSGVRGYRFVLSVMIRDKKDKRFLDGGDMDQRRCYGLNEVEFLNDGERL